MFHADEIKKVKPKPLPFVYVEPNSFLYFLYCKKGKLWKYTPGDYFFDPFPTFVAFLVPCGACLIHGMAMERVTGGYNIKFHLSN